MDDDAALAAVEEAMKEAMKRTKDPKEGTYERTRTTTWSSACGTTLTMHRAMVAVVGSVDGSAGSERADPVFESGPESVGLRGSKHIGRASLIP